MDSPEIWTALIQRFLGSNIQVEGITPAHGGFSGACVVRVDTNLGSYALRGVSPGELPRERTLERHRWLQYLFAEGVPVAVPVPTTDSLETLVTAGGREWHLEPWLTGKAAVLAEMTPQRWSSLMQTLARMHQISASFVSTPQGREWFHVREGCCPSVAQRRGIIARWSPAKLVSAREGLAGAPDAFQEVSLQILTGFLTHVEQVDRELAALENETFLLHPCLRDLWRAHVLFEGDEVSGLIDATAARTEHVATDLSRLLGSFFSDAQKTVWEEALQAYESVRPLAAAERQLIHALGRSSVLLSGMTWIERWLCGSLPVQQLAEVVARMEMIATQLRTL